MEGVVWEPAAFELALVEAVDEQADSTVQRIRATREAARGSCQTSEIVTQLGIVGFDGVGLGLAFGDFVATKVEPERGVGLISITVIPLGLGPLIDHGLQIVSGALPDDLPAQEAVRGPINVRYKVDPVFLSPMKVKSSSSSAFSTLSGTGTGGKFSA